MVKGKPTAPQIPIAIPLYRNSSGPLNLEIPMIRSFVIALAVAFVSSAAAQQPPQAPAPLYSITMGMTGKQAADLVNAVANSDLPARIAVPLINEISGQVNAQNEAREVAAAKAAAEVKAASEAKAAADKAAADKAAKDAADKASPAAE